MTGVTREDIEKLPRWARVAFAARCGRLVQPSLDRSEEIADWKKKVVERVIESVEQYAARTATDVKAVATAAADAKAVFSVTTSASAAQVAAYAAYAANADDPAFYAARAAAHAYTATAIAAPCIQSAYDKLLAAAQAENWGDDTPVPPEFFGPVSDLFGEEGEDDSQATDDEGSEPEHAYVSIELSFPTDATDEQIKESSLEWIHTLNHATQAINLCDLTVDDIKIEQEAPVAGGLPK